MKGHSEGTGGRRRKELFVGLKLLAAAAALPAAAATPPPALDAQMDPLGVAAAAPEARPGPAWQSKVRGRPRQSSAPRAECGLAGGSRGRAGPSLFNRRGENELRKAPAGAGAPGWALVWARGPQREAW